MAVALGVVNHLRLWVQGDFMTQQSQARAEVHVFVIQKIALIEPTQLSENVLGNTMNMPPTQSG